VIYIEAYDYPNGETRTIFSFDINKGDLSEEVLDAVQSGVESFCEWVMIELNIAGIRVSYDDIEKKLEYYRYDEDDWELEWRYSH